jgi:hypothetical protein
VRVSYTEFYYFERMYEVQLSRSMLYTVGGVRSQGYCLPRADFEDVCVSEHEGKGEMCVYIFSYWLI